MLSLTRVTFLLGLLLSLIPVARASAQCGGTQLCAAGPGVCEVTANCTISGGDFGILFDLGARPFVVRKNKVLNVTGIGGITVYAASIELEMGAKIVATGGPGNYGASIALEATGDVLLRGDSLLDVRSDLGAGTVALRSGGRIEAAGSIRADSAASGGNIEMDTFLDDGTDITIGGEGISTAGGAAESGGFVDVSAGTGITLSAPINARGGSGDGGAVTMQASGGDVFTAPGGSINTTATGGGDSGYGGDVEITASGQLTISAAITANGDGGGGNGGVIEITAEDGSATISGRIETNAGTGAGTGGDITVSATGTILVANALVATSGSLGSGGTVDLSTSGAISLFEPIDVAGGWGGSITAVADGALTVYKALTASGAGPLAGSIELQGCNVVVQNTGSLTSTGPGTFPAGSNVLEASGTMTVNGNLTAGASSENQLWYRSVVPTWNPAKVTPAPVVQQSMLLPCCVGCPVTTTTTSTTSTSVSTTSTSSTSSTTLATTTSTSLVPTTTTTTTSVASTTSTTSSSVTSTSSSTSTSSTTSTTTTTTSTTTSSTTTTSTTVDTTSTTVESSTTTTTTRPSTTSTVVVTTSTTTTTLPLTCLDMPLEGFEAVDCRLGTLADTLSAQPPTDLGGTRSANQLKVKVAKARKLVTTARGAKKPSVVLKRADRQLRAFDKVVGKMAAKGKLAAELRDRLIGLSQSTLAEIGVLRAG